MSGAVDAVLHYNAFSRLMTALLTQPLGVPIIGFSDEFPELAPRFLANKTAALFTRLCATLGGCA